MEHTIKVQNSNSLFVEYNVSKLLLGFNGFITGVVTASGAAVTLTQGMIMGQIAATGKIVPMKSAATDGSQYPFGIVLNGEVVADGTSSTINLVNKGRINENIVKFEGTDDMDTAIGATNNLRTYRALLNDMGFEFEIADELTAVDNS